MRSGAYRFNNWRNRVAGKRIVVYVDGLIVRVPERVVGWDEIRRVLKVNSDAGIAFFVGSGKRRPGLPSPIYDVEGWSVMGASELVTDDTITEWSFRTGDRYKTLPLVGDDSPERQPWEQDPDAWKR